MDVSRTDIFVSGGGLAGLTAAATLSARGFAVTLADPAPPATDAADNGSDLRSTAFLDPARALLDRAGVWDRLAPLATPLTSLRLVDSKGWPPRIRGSRTFHAADLGLDAFGWNLPNWRTAGELITALDARDGVDLRLGRAFAALDARDGSVTVTLDDGAHIEARLVLAADGHASPVRKAHGIAAARTGYGQKALAFTVAHDVPHDHVSTEIYNRGGAFVLVPLPDRDGRHASAVVWMDDGPRALRLAEMPALAFEAELIERSCNVLGSLTLTSPRRVWPIVTQTARRITAPRTALIAEAAHVMPPIGAQGLNTSLADIADLAGRLDPGADPGSPDILAAFARARALDMRVRSGAVDILNRVCRSGNPLVQAARLAAFAALHDITPLRRGIMRAGLGSI